MSRNYSQILLINCNQIRTVHRIWEQEYWLGRVHLYLVGRMVGQGQGVWHLIVER